MLIHKIRNTFINKKIIYKILSFFLPIFLILIVLLLKQIKVKYYLHSENFLIADMLRQYVGIFSHIWDAFKGNDSLFYTFNNGIGGNMASTIGYYASSPLNVLYLLGSKEHIPVITFVIYLIKSGLIGLFMNIFLNYKFGHKFTNLIFSTMYALSAYTVNYYFHTMWFDAVALTPLIMLGINKIIENNDIKLYVISLGLAIIANFYTAYMVCIFSVFYILYELFIIDKENKIKIFGRYVLSSLLALGLACFLFLPVIYNITNVYRANMDAVQLYRSFPWIVECFLTKFMGRMFIASYKRDLIMWNYPSIYCGMLSFILFFFWLFNKNIKKRERIFSLIIIAFFIISMCTPILMLFWHGNTYPNGYFSRFSFLFIFFVIYLSAKSFYNHSNFRLKHYIIFSICYTVVVIVTVLKRVGEKRQVTISLFSIITSCVFILIYLIILYIMNKKKHQKIINYSLFGIVLIELMINYYSCLVTRVEWKADREYKTFYNNYCQQVNHLDSKFYRMSSEYGYGAVDSMICDNKNYSISLSTNSKKTYEFLKNNGGHVTYLDIWYDHNKIPILDSVLGIKYYISSNDWKGSYYKKLPNKLVVKEKNIDSKKDLLTELYVYENPYALGIGYLIPNDYKKIYASEKVNDSIDSLNRLMKTLSGNKQDVLIKYPIIYQPNDQIYSNYIFDINNDKKYIYLNFKYMTTNYIFSDTTISNVSINDKSVASPKTGNMTAIKLINKYANKKIMVNVSNYSLSNSPADSMNIYYVDDDVLEKDFKIIKKHQLKKVKIYDNKMSGEIDVPTPSVLATSIPYEKGWKVYVDGKKVNYEKVADEFIGIKLNKGYHKIKMVFYPPYLCLGAIISIISLSILIIYEIIYYRKWRFKNERQEKKS